MQALADGLADLTRTVEGFKNRNALPTARVYFRCLQASHAAIRTHQEEKLKALRNAVLNIAIGRTPDEDEQAVFLWYIDSLTTWHLRILKFLENPLKPVQERHDRTDYAIAASLSQPLEEVFLDCPNCNAQVDGEVIGSVDMDRQDCGPAGRWLVSASLQGSDVVGSVTLSFHERPSSRELSKFALVLRPVV